jgi:hypothetical protein
MEKLCLQDVLNLFRMFDAQLERFNGVAKLVTLQYPNFQLLLRQAGVEPLTAMASVLTTVT